MGQILEMGEFLARLFSLFSDCFSDWIGLIGNTSSSGCICVAIFARSLAAAAIGAIVGFRAAWRGALHSAARPGCHSCRTEWSRGRLRHHHPLVFIASRDGPGHSWLINSDRYCADAGGRNFLRMERLSS